MTRPRRPEAVAQARAKALYRACGCQVWDTSQTQTRALHVSPGVPDLIVFHPRSGRTWYHEVKTAHGRVSPAQHRFATVAAQCGIPVITGDELAARRHLVQLGLLAMELGAA